jgi:hypothetical protein
MVREMTRLAMLGLAVVTVGCANTGIAHVSADEFIRQAKTMEYANSAHGTFYIGASPTRVYVERTGLYRVLRLHKAMVYWTELDGLPDELAAAIRAGKCPWTRWQGEIRKVDGGL